MDFRILEFQLCGRPPEQGPQKVNNLVRRGQRQPRNGVPSSITPGFFWVVTQQNASVFQFLSWGDV